MAACGCLIAGRRQRCQAVAGCVGWLLVGCDIHLLEFCLVQSEMKAHFKEADIKYIDPSCELVSLAQGWACQHFIPLPLSWLPPAPPGTTAAAARVVA